MSEKKTAADYRDEAQAGQQRVEQAVSQLTLERSAQHKAHGYTQERDLVSQLIARAQLAHGLGKVLNLSALLDLKRIKKQKLYRVLSGEPLLLANGEMLTVSTWADFCEALGISHQTVDEQLRNLDAFGAEALDAMNRCGLGYRDLRKLRKLPEDAQQVIVGEVEVHVGDKEALVSLIDDMAVKHAKEKSILEKQLDTQKRHLEQKKKDIDTRDEQIADLQGQLEEKQAKAPTPEASERAYLLKLGQHEDQVRAIALDLSPAMLQSSTPHCRLKAAHMAEYMEVYGRKLRDELMHGFPELWDPGSIPDANLLHDNRGELERVTERLEDGLPVKTEDLS